MRQMVMRSVALFVGLAVVAAVLVVAASAVGEGFGRSVLLTFAAAVFGAALAVFLLQVTLTLPTGPMSR